jgi:hypothetical protein
MGKRILAPPIMGCQLIGIICCIGGGRKENLELIHQAVQENPDFLCYRYRFRDSKCSVLAKRTLSKLFMPFHKKVNDWVRNPTQWKTFMHSCGAVELLINEFGGEN